MKDKNEISREIECFHDNCQRLGFEVMETADKIYIGWSSLGDPVNKISSEIIDSAQELLKITDRLRETYKVFYYRNINLEYLIKWKETAQTLKTLHSDYNHTCSRLKRTTDTVWEITGNIGLVEQINYLCDELKTLSKRLETVEQELEEYIAFVDESIRNLRVVVL